MSGKTIEFLLAGSWLTLRSVTALLLWMDGLVTGGLHGDMTTGVDEPTGSSLSFKCFIPPFLAIVNLQNKQANEIPQLGWSVVILLNIGHLYFWKQRILASSLCVCAPIKTSVWIGTNIIGLNVTEHYQACASAQWSHCAQRWAKLISQRQRRRKWTE